jgi:DNA-binding response OmpR family regulator
MTIRLSPLTSELILRKKLMNLRLLATDSDPLLLEIFRAYFPNFGFEVATAGNGLECLALLREFAPDVLVLSLELQWGGADGILSIVREETAMRPIPVVLTIDGISRSKAVPHLFPPVVKLLEKPFRVRDLRAIIEAALQVRGAPGRCDFQPHVLNDGQFAGSHKSFIPRIH